MMKGRKFIQQVIWVIVITLLLAGCSAPATPTPVPPTPTPTSEPLPEYDPDTILVTFTGNECTSTVPAELPVGEHQFVIRDLSANNPEFGLSVGYYLDGHTYQDILDMQSEPGEYFPKPSWVVESRMKLVGTENWPIDKVYTFYLDTVGEHGFSADALYPPSHWECGSFQVVEAPSE